MSNQIEKILIRYFKSHGYRVNNNKLHKSLLTSPTYPSLYAISKTIKSLGVQNMHVSLAPEDLAEIDYPAIAHMEKSGDFVLLEKKSDIELHYHDGEKAHRESLDEFCKKWGGTVLLLAFDPSDEQRAAGSNSRHLNFKTGPAHVLGLWLMVLVYFSQHNVNLFSWCVAFALLMACLYLSFKLYKVDSKVEREEDKLCAIFKTDCKAVVTSEQGKLLGKLSWSAVGTLFFGTEVFMMASMLIVGRLNDALYLIQWLSVLALPMSLYALYLQKYVLKEWCSMCLLIHGLNLLIVVLTTLHFQGIAFDQLPIQPLLFFSFGIIIFLVVGYVLLEKYVPEEKYLDTKRTLNEFKSNHEIFEYLSSKEQSEPEAKVEYMTVMGNSDARHCLTLVTNPFCKPCAKVHDQLNELIQEMSGQIRVNVVMIIHGLGSQQIAKLIRHITSLSITESPELFHKALDDWYKMDDKEGNYMKWIDKYPTSREVNYAQLDEKFRQQAIWLNEARLNVTPRVFVNGFMLPRVYTVTDLKYILD